MNPRSQNEKADALLNLLAELIPMSEADVDQAMVNMKAEMKRLVDTLKKVNEPKGEELSMRGIISFERNYRSEKIEDFRLQSTIESLIAIALWAVVFNKTMPEATEVYCKTLKNGVLKS